MFGMHRMAGDGMEIKGYSDVNQGDLQNRESFVGVRAAIVAKKYRNGYGAKGGRKIDANSRHGWKETYGSV